MYNVIFCDCDGVVNSNQYIKRIGELFDHPQYQMDPEAVARLNRITDLTGAKIVVSSTWRLAFPGQLEGLQACFASHGITGQVIDMTPDKPNCVRNRRGKEIQAWLDANHGLVDKFVIIDDDTDTGRLRKYQVVTLFEDGLQDHHIQMVVDRLGLRAEVPIV